MDKLLAVLLLRLVHVYRHFISPMMTSRCRFYPTCSCYAIEAINLHGGYHGGLLTLKRIARCHPWGGQGIDFVPRPLYRYAYYYIDRYPSYFMIYRYQLY